MTQSRVLSNDEFTFVVRHVPACHKGMTESPLAVLDCYSGMGRAKIWALVPTLQTELERARIGHVILVSTMAAPMTRAMSARTCGPRLLFHLGITRLRPAGPSAA